MDQIQRYHNINRKNFLKYARISFVLVFMSIFVPLILSFFQADEGAQILQPLLFIAAAISGIIGFMHYICPKCKTKLGMAVHNAYWVNPAKCPSCDVSLN